MINLTDDSRKSLNELTPIMYHPSTKKLLDSFNTFYENDRLKHTFDALKKCYTNNHKIKHHTTIINPEIYFEQNLKTILTMQGYNKNQEGYKSLLILTNKTNIKLKFNNTTIFNITIIHDPNNLNKIYPIIKRFMAITKYFKTASTIQHITELEITIILNNLKRCIYKNETIENSTKNGRFGANSAYTSFQITPENKHMKIVCTKSSQILQLLTHELGHLYGFDMGILKNDNNNIYLSNNSDNHTFKNMGIDKFMINETICNTNTTIINSMCFAIESNSDYDNFVFINNIEIIYSIYHTAKILYVNKFDNFNKFIKNNKTYKQTAYLFEYTITRSLLLCHINQYMNIIQNFTSKNNNNKQIEQDVTKYIFEIMNDDNEFNNIFNNIFDEFIKIIKKQDVIDMEYFCIDGYNL